MAEDLSIRRNPIRAAQDPFAGAEVSGSGEAVKTEALPQAKATEKTAKKSDPKAKKTTGETRYTEAKSVSQGKKTKSKDKTASKEAFAKEVFRGATSGAERNDSAQDVSNRLSAFLEAQRGKGAAELMEHGQLGKTQTADYVAGRELREPNLDLSLQRAQTLLASSNEPALRQSVVQGLDSLIAPGLSYRGTQAENDKAAVQQLEGRLQNFFDNPKISHAEKMHVASAVAEHSKNPTLRCAMAVSLNNHLEKTREHLKQDKKELKDSYNLLELGKIPGDITQYRMERTQHIQQLEKQIPAEQEVLGKLLMGQDKSMPGESNQTLGKLRTYLEQHHNGQELEVGKSLMQSLFTPPSATVMQQFANTTKELTTSDRKEDAHGFGFLLEAGRQALEVDPKRKQEADLAMGASALQVAVAFGLGAITGAGVPFSLFAGEIQDAAGSAIGQLGEEAIGLFIESASNNLTKKGVDIKKLQSECRPRFVHADSYKEFQAGMEYATREADLDR